LTWGRFGGECEREFGSPRQGSWHLGPDELRAALPPSLFELRGTSRSAAGLRWFAPSLLHQDYGGQVGRDEAGALLFDLFEVAL